MGDKLEQLLLPFEFTYGGKPMDLQKRSDMLAKAKKMLSDKSAAAELHKNGKKTAYELMNTLFDDGTFSEIGAFVKAYANELGTSDTAQYEGVVCGYGAVDGRLVFAYAQDASRAGGVFTKAAAAKIAALYELALKNGAPVVSMLDSHGSRYRRCRRACRLRKRYEESSVRKGQNSPDCRYLRRRSRRRRRDRLHGRRCRYLQ